MKKLFIVANWKSNKNSKEATSWLEGFKNYDLGFKDSNKEVIVCSPFTLLPSLTSFLSNHKSHIQLGGQDVSPFPKGAYTGEVASDQLREYAAYVIIGHSERRKYFYEDDQMLANKVDMAREAGIVPLFCVQDQVTAIPKGVTMVAYEPVFAIGTGKAETPKNANEIAQAIKEKSNVKLVLYGGSVTDANVHSFTKEPDIDGVLVGSASLDPALFSHIIKNA